MIDAETIQRLDESVGIVTIDEVITKRLEDWGRWARNDPGVGWPHINIIGVIQKQKVSAGESGGYINDTTPEIMEVENAVLALTAWRLHLARALKLRYVQNKNDDEARQIMKRCKSTYRKYLSEAEHWMSGRLG